MPNRRLSNRRRTTRKNRRTSRRRTSRRSSIGGHKHTFSEKCKACDKDDFGAGDYDFTPKQRCQFVIREKKKWRREEQRAAKFEESLKKAKLAKKKSKSKSKSRSK